MYMSTWMNAIYGKIRWWVWNVRWISHVPNNMHYAHKSHIEVIYSILLYVLLCVVWCSVINSSISTWVAFVRIWNMQWFLLGVKVCTYIPSYSIRLPFYARKERSTPTAIEAFEATIICILVYLFFFCCVEDKITWQ